MFLRKLFEEFFAQLPLGFLLKRRKGFAFSFVRTKKKKQKEKRRLPLQS